MICRARDSASVLGMALENNLLSAQSAERASYLTNMLKQKFPSQDVYGVTEITSPTDITYFIKLEGANSWTTVQVDNDGNALVIEKYNKDN